MTARVLERKTLITRLEWQIKVATERPSNYDGRVTVNAADLQQLIAEMRRMPDPPPSCDMHDWAGGAK